MRTLENRESQFNGDQSSIDQDEQTGLVGQVVQTLKGLAEGGEVLRCSWSPKDQVRLRSGMEPEGRPLHPNV